MTPTAYTDAYTEDGEVAEITEYATAAGLALCVIATPSGTFTEWRHCSTIQVEAA